jgi:Zn-dependent protease
MFIFLNVFNLLPVSPMDGGQMLETLFFSTKKVVQTIFLVLSAIIIAFLALGTKNYALLLIDVFLLMRIILIWRKKMPLQGEAVNAEDTEEEIIMSNTGKAAFSILWLLSMVMPLLALIRIMLNR